MGNVFSVGALSTLLWLALALGGVGLTLLLLTLIREGKDKTLW